MEKDLVEGNCPECGRPVDQIKEANYFFRMSKYQDWLIKYIEDHPEFIQPDFRRNETLGFLRNELNDLCISRPKSRLSWGIEMPFDADYVTYVWFDALVNYISTIGYSVDDKHFEQWWPADYHLIGKDILTTHTVYWPTMLKAMGVSMPKTIFAHGWWLIGESKMSKSLGNVVNPMDMADRYGVDAFRYFLMAEMTLGQDAGFTEDGFVQRFNSDLANDLGNLLSRVLKMIARYCDGVIPPTPAAPAEGSAESELWMAARTAVDEMEQSIFGMRLDLGLASVFNAVRATNRYIERKQPWTLNKTGKADEVACTLYTAAEVLRVVGALLFPVMPGKMAALRRALGIEALQPDFEKLQTWGGLVAGRQVDDGIALFPRVQVKAEAAAAEEKKKDKSAGKKKAMNESSKDETQAEGIALIGFDEFQKVDLRTAKVMEAEKIEDADKLLRLQVMMGKDRRQLVAGIAQHYDPDDLIGKSIVVVANLKPAKIRGVESQGMLLAAKGGETLRLITVDGEISSGAPIN
jgi:methionyl-tRNA synthetase